MDHPYDQMVDLKHFDSCSPIITWYQSKDGLAETPLDTNIFTATFSNNLVNLDAHPSDGLAAGVYDLSYKVEHPGTTPVSEYKSSAYL